MEAEIGSEPMNATLAEPHLTVWLVRRPYPNAANANGSADPSESSGRAKVAGQPAQEFGRVGAHRGLRHENAFRKGRRGRKAFWCRRGDCLAIRVSLNRRHGSKPSRVILRYYFRMAQMAAVLSGWARKDLMAVQRRSVSSCSVRAMKSQNQSAFKRSQSRSMGLKSGE